MALLIRYLGRRAIRKSDESACAEALMENEVADEILQSPLLVEMGVCEGIQCFAFRIIRCASDGVGEEFSSEAPNEGAGIGEEVLFEGDNVVEPGAVGQDGGRFYPRPLVLFCVGNGIGFAPLADGVEVLEQESVGVDFGVTPRAAFVARMGFQQVADGCCATGVRGESGH